MLGFDFYFFFFPPCPLLLGAGRCSLWAFARSFARESVAAKLTLSLAYGSLQFSDTCLISGQLLQHLKRIISDLCKLYNLPQHPDVEMLDQPLPAEQVSDSRGDFLSS